MRLSLSMRNGIISLDMDDASLKPNPGNVAALAKCYAHKIAEESTMSIFEAVSVFKVIYASMIIEYANIKGITLTPEMEKETELFAIKYARDVDVTLLEGSAPSPVKPSVPLDRTLVNGSGRSFIPDPDFKDPCASQTEHDPDKSPFR